jgi:hypothetical protein
MAALALETRSRAPMVVDDLVRRFSPCGPDIHGDCPAMELDVAGRVTLRSGHQQTAYGGFKQVPARVGAQVTNMFRGMPAS